LEGEVPLVERLRWLRRAAEQGHGDAQYYLGMRYTIADGVRRDSAEARKWLERAAHHGQGRAAHLLGSMFLTGKVWGLNQEGSWPLDNAVGLYWMQRAAQLGDSRGAAILAWSYAGGKGVAQDPVEAYKWFWIGAPPHYLVGGYSSELVPYINARKTLAEHLTAAQVEEGTARATEWWIATFGPIRQ
jgi:hypothetical protein